MEIEIWRDIPGYEGEYQASILDVYGQGGRWRKLSIEDVDAIRFGFVCGISGAELSRMYRVFQQVISSIKHGRTFSWLT